MFIHDVPVKNSLIRVRVMFDNRSELTIISSFLVKKENLSVEGSQSKSKRFYSSCKGRAIRSQKAFTKKILGHCDWES